MSSALLESDQARGEIEVVSNWILQYMMQTGIDMFQRESSYLAKAFEMSNLQMQAFIHPVQQFASTLDDRIDSRNHLDIINKVSAI